MAEKIPVEIDVLCVGNASYDLYFSVDSHPGPDEKVFASALLECGGGPAANAAVTVSRLGLKAAWAGYLGTDTFGEKYFRELAEEKVVTDYVLQGPDPTPLSAILVKPDGKRTVINRMGDTRKIKPQYLDLSSCTPKVILFDGHEPLLSLPLAEQARQLGQVTVLDAGSVHQGTEALADKVDYLAASQKFACDFTSEQRPEKALGKLSAVSPHVIITMGEKGLIWKTDKGEGYLSAFPITALDTTGAGDVFHGALAAGIAQGKRWSDLLKYASVAAALCCTKLGARPGIPSANEVDAFLKANP